MTQTDGSLTPAHQNERNEGIVRVTKEKKQRIKQKREKKTSELDFLRPEQKEAKAAFLADLSSFRRLLEASGLVLGLGLRLGLGLGLALGLRFRLGKARVLKEIGKRRCVSMSVSVLLQSV